MNCKRKSLIVSITIVLFCIVGWFFFISGIFSGLLTTLFPSLIPFMDRLEGKKGKRFERIAVIPVSSGRQHENTCLYTAAGEKFMILGPVSFFPNSDTYVKISSSFLGNFVETSCYFSKKYVLLPEIADGFIADISNDMKGWDVDYIITDDGSMLHYIIRFPPEEKFQKITFSIPKKYFSSDAIQNKRQAMIHVRPYRLKEK